MFVRRWNDLLGSKWYQEGNRAKETPKEVLDKIPLLN